jgi:hypothetical protein
MFLFNQIIPLALFSHRINFPNYATLSSPQNKNSASNGPSTVARSFVAADTWLQRRCLAIVASIHSNIPAFSRHVTMYSIYIYIYMYYIIFCMILTEQILKMTSRNYEKLL